MANPLVELRKLAQSVWHDNIKRELLTSGKLAKLVHAGEITGLTSNPTIFEQAISGSRDYDADLRRLAREGKSAEEIFYVLAIDDIRAAADLFRRVFDETRGRDGFVSIECAPRLANDTQKTIEEAHRLWERVARPNLMVKIPATREGVPAIEQCISDGLNINVTLIFSRKRYDEVMNAYLKGLIRRFEARKPIDHVNSVASFFVSRVDSLVDKLLDEKIAQSPGKKERLEALKGKAAIANAQLAYQDFRKKFATEAYAGLKNQGAPMQRPLWASTSTKNPAYPDTYYVEALIGPDSVDTMPPATIDAYRDRGKPEVRIDRGIEDAERVMRDLAEVGIDMVAVTKQLEEDGVAAFAKSFDSLIATVEKQRAIEASSAPQKKASTPAAKRVPKSRPAASKRKARKPAKKAPAKKTRSRGKTTARKAKPARKTKPARKAKPARKVRRRAKPPRRKSARAGRRR